MRTPLVILQPVGRGDAAERMQQLLRFLLHPPSPHPSLSTQQVETREPQSGAGGAEVAPFQSRVAVKVIDENET